MRSGDIGAHSIDAAQWITGRNITGVSALLETFVNERPVAGDLVGLGGHGATGEDVERGPVTVDDAAIFSARFAGDAAERRFLPPGPIGVFEATRFALGRKNAMRLELNGTMGSLAFDFEDMNSLSVYDAADGPDAGFRKILVTEPEHPYTGNWWPTGHGLGYEHVFTHQAGRPPPRHRRKPAARHPPSPTPCRSRKSSPPSKPAPAADSHWHTRLRGNTMTRPITLFTGQWADLPFEEVARLAGEWGFDGLEIACWGDHLDPQRAVEDDAYLQGRLDILDKHQLKVHAIANHLTGQAVCDDPIDERHEGILPADVWGDGDAEGVRTRAAEAMKTTARAAARLGVQTVTGFTGSSIWKCVAMFPPASDAMIERGYQDFADRWNPILDVFDEEGVRFALEVHPSEIAYDYWTAKRTLEAIGHRESFGLNFDPSHFIWQDLDPVMFLQDFADKIFHVHVKESVRQLNGRNGRLGSHLPWADPRRGWDFVTAGHGDVNWEPIFRTLNAIGYQGPTSVEWEDAGMDRLIGAPQALALVKELAAITPPAAAFDAAFAAR